jgi:hypothetical protein
MMGLDIRGDRNSHSKDICNSIYRLHAIGYRDLEWTLGVGV